MNITINKSVFNNGTYTINDDIKILTFHQYLSEWFGELRDDFTNIMNICDDYFDLLHQFREYCLDNDNCIVIVSNISSDEYIYIWKINTNNIYDMGCNEQFIELDDVNNVGVRCLLSGLCYRVLNGYNL